MKNFLIALSSVLFLLIPVNKINGCGYYPNESEYRVIMFQPDVTNALELSALFYTPDRINYDALASIDEPMKEVNCKEWQNHCKYKGSWKDIYQALYITDALDVIYDTANLKTKNAFVHFLKTKRKKEYEYFVYARKCDLIINSKDPWNFEKTTASQIEVLRKCQGEGMTIYNTTGSDFLKMRSAYQLLKINYYHSWLGEEVESIYKTKIEPIETNSWIKESAKFYCIDPTYDNAYDYKLSLCFDKSIDKRFRCVQLFSRKNLKTTLKLAKNQHEKATMYVMYELQNPGRSLSNLEKIYSFDPTHKDLPVLVSRELNKIEHWLLTPELTGEDPTLFGADYYTDGVSKINDLSDKRYMNSVYSFIKKAGAQQDQNDKALWNLLTAHCALLLNKMDEAAMYLSISEKIATEPKLKIQIKLDQLLLHFDGKTRLDKQTEKEILDFSAYYKNHKDLFMNEDAMLNQFYLFAGKRLIKAGDVAKGIFLVSKSNLIPGMISYWAIKDSYIVMMDNAKANDYDSAIFMLNKKNKTPFEKFLTERNVSPAENYYYDEALERPDTLPLNVNKLLDYKSMYYVRQNQLDSALQCVNKIEPSYWKEHPYQMFQCFPFKIPFGTDYQSNNDFYVYNKRMYLQRMCDLLSLIEKKEGDLARHHFVLANGYFNMSYHGNFWIMNMPYKLSDEVQNDYYKINIADKEFSNNYYGCKQAEYHYLEAMKLSKDSTFAVLCAARASSCNINYQEISWRRTARYDSNKYDWNKEFYPRYGKHKKQYEILFGKSDYYDDFVSNCYYYEHLNKKFY